MIEIIALTEKEQWNSIVRSMTEYDFYYLAEYHELDTAGIPLLIYFNHKETRIALPVILRDIEGSPMKDLTSVYGYAGPLSYPAIPDAESLQLFHEELSDLFDSMQAVSLFSRLHPLFTEQNNLLQQLGDVKNENLTVAIDLGQTVAEQRKHYSRSLRTQLNRLKRKGFYVKQATTPEEVKEYVTIYHETMDRVNASPYYYFTEDYFNRFLGTIDSALFLGYHGDQITSGSLCTFANVILQVHLNATRNDFLPYSPLKQVIDEARKYGVKHGMRWLHLGGGHDGDHNSLFQFKSRFSDTYCRFKTWRYVHNREEYTRLSEGKDQRSTYFPLYRS